MDAEQGFEATGIAWCRGCLDHTDLSAFERAATMDHADGPGARVALDGPLAAALDPQGALCRAAAARLPGARPVRALVFDKSAEANWQVPWLQDRVIAVAARHDLPGFGPWSQKHGVWHVEPPAALLERMMFARVHLDDTDLENGCLEVACGTHRLGQVPAAEAQARAQAAGSQPCLARRGDVLFVKALTLHRSRPSRSTTRRRTFRIDFAAGALPPPLAWAADEPATA